MARTLKQQIRKIIRQHYGEDLSEFRADVNYRDATEPFVDAVARVLKGEIEYASDWQCELAKYDKVGSLEFEIGKRLRNIRILKDLTTEEVAEKMGVHPNYLKHLEDGEVVSDISILLKTLKALKANRKEKTYIADAFRKDIPVQDKIRDVIYLYYGKSLWTLRPQLDYEESIALFVQALVGLDQSGRSAMMLPQPSLPSRGKMVVIEKEKRSTISDTVREPALIA